MTQLATTVTGDGGHRYVRMFPGRALAAVARIGRAPAEIGRAPGARGRARFGPEDQGARPMQYDCCDAFHLEFVYYFPYTSTSVTYFILQYL